MAYFPDPYHWKLDGRQPVPCSVDEWVVWFKNADRRVASERIAGILVSTVFLGLDHNFFGEGNPILFETMLFTEIDSDLIFDDVDIGTQRYTTWEAAEVGHRETVEKLKTRLPKVED